MENLLLFIMQQLVQGREYQDKFLLRTSPNSPYNAASSGKVLLKASEMGGKFASFVYVTINLMMMRPCVWRPTGYPW